MPYAKKIYTLLLCLMTLGLTAQSDSDIYAVHLGQFMNAKATAFSVVDDLGYIYAVKNQGSVKDVYIGGVKGKAAADRAVVAPRDRGYIDAYAKNLSAEKAATVTVIQLAARDAREPIEWRDFTRAGYLMALLNGNQIKIVTGPYADPNAAKNALPALQKQGFKDAFVKNVSDALLHAVTPFESGSVDLAQFVPAPETKKQTPTEAGAESAKIPTDSAETKTKKSDPAPVNTKSVPPAAKTSVPVTRPPRETPVAQPLIARKPGIRANVKRSSVLRLQEILKSEKSYNSSLDGYYGTGTQTAFTKTWQANAQLKKYRILAQYGAEQKASAARPGSLQYALDGLWDDPQNALLTLERSNAPTAKAYRAYWLFENNGKQIQIDELMSAAVKEAFAGKKARSVPGFDHTAAYSYRDFPQLLQHLSYVQAADAEPTTVPCWLFARYRKQAAQIFGGAAGNRVTLGDCGGFTDWEELQVLRTIAEDISTGSKIVPAKEAEYRARAARLFLAPAAPSAVEIEAAEKRSNTLLRHMDGWAANDAYLSAVQTAFNLTYYQSYVLLEDYFAGQGFEAAAAKGLALMVLESVLGTKTDRFM